MAGPYAFLFADVADSVALTREARGLSENGADWLAEVERAFRQEAEAHGGRYYFREGDRFQAAFPDCASALTAVRKIVARLNTLSIPGGNPKARARVRLRFGVHFGEADVVVPPQVTDGNPPPYREDYTGVAVALTARLMALARPGQVLLSDEARMQCPALQSEIRPIGKYRLKGLGWHRVYCVADPARLLETHPPLALGTPVVFRAALGAVLLAVACVALAQNAWRWQNPASAGIGPGGILQTFSNAGKPLLRIPLERIYAEVLHRKGVTNPQPFRVFGDIYGVNMAFQQSRVANLDGKGSNEIVVSVISSERGEKQATSILAALSPTGNILWWWMPDRKIVTETQQGPDSLSTGIVYVGDLDRDGFPEILVTAYNYPESAEGIYVLSHDGKVLCEWWNWGAAVPGVADLDKDGVNEILVAGVNEEPGMNPRGDAILAVLKWKTFELGSAPQKSGAYEIKGISEGGASAFIRLPPTDLSLHFNNYEFGRISRVENNQFTIESNVIITPNQYDKHALVYFTFNNRLELLDIKPDDTYKTAHTALWRAGKLSRNWPAMLASMMRAFQTISQP